jgi:dipeptidyl aminopeptidase/acylaminoacyl peptidase
MNEREVRDALRRAAPDDDAARERSWRVVRAAYAGQHAQRPRRRRWLAFVAAFALLPVAVGAAAAATTPDHGVGHWVRSMLGATDRDTRAALLAVPGGGRLLVTGPDGVWVVSADGSKRRLGAYEGASWSPRGLFVIAWRGRELTALDPGGRVRWSLPRAGQVASARWGPVDGFRVAYVAGEQLRIVNGDGTADHRYAAASPELAPAWRPDNTHVLAFVDPRERVSVVAVDARQRQWRSAALPGLSELVWSPRGDRLLAIARRRIVLFDGSGAVLATRIVPAGSTAGDAEWAPRGSQVAVVQRRADGSRSEIVLLDAARRLRVRRSVPAPGRLTSLAYSPGGERLLVGWPEGDQWLFLRPHGGARLSAVANIARQFMPGATAPAFPGPVEWCCRAGRP